MNETVSIQFGTVLAWGGKSCQLHIKNVKEPKYQPLLSVHSLSTSHHKSHLSCFSTGHGGIFSIFFLASYIIQSLKANQSQKHSSMSADMYKENCLLLDSVRQILLLHIKATTVNTAFILPCDIRYTSASTMISVLYKTQ